MEIIEKLEYVKSLVFQNDSIDTIKDLERSVYESSEGILLQSYEISLPCNHNQNFIVRKFKINDGDCWYKIHYNGYLCLSHNGEVEYYKYNMINLNNLKGLLMNFYTESYMTYI